ncbi:serine hydrolase [Chryseobacterium sp. JK1]|uniref:serine hydrolase n=1 Tax=Chryseobacterium sp. JK1 TaxID=874294 RepID=UPI003D68D7F6
MTPKIIVFLLLCLFTIGYGQNKKEFKNQTNSGLDSLKITAEKLMKQKKLNGLSVAVFEDYKVIWTNQWGIKEAGSAEKIDVNTAFSTASISKPITAIVCAILEEKGLINLDDPISRYIKRWELPKSDFTKDTEVTWKHLLSHTSGTSQGGFEDYYEGDSIPTIVQSLNGILLPRTKEPIKFLFKPGTNWEYSGGGYVIVQLALEDHLQKPMPAIVKEYLLDPLQLKNSTMIQPNEKGFLINVAKVHNDNGEIIRTGVPITPQVAPSGLWSTPSDLAVIAIEMQKALIGKDNKVISTNVAKKVTDIVTLMGPRGWGYGWQRSVGWGNQEWFFHDGSNTGVGGDVLANMKNGSGIVILANGDKPNRYPLMSHIKNKVFSILNWNLPKDKKSIKKIPKSLAKAISGVYTEFLLGYTRIGMNTIFQENNILYINSPVLKQDIGIEKNKMSYLGNNTFVIDNYPNLIRFDLNKNNELTGMTIFKEQENLKKLIIPIDKLRTIDTKLYDAFRNNDYEKALYIYQQIKMKDPIFNFENALNNLGYQFSAENQSEIAFNVFNLNVKEFPMSSNVYDSRGETYFNKKNYLLSKKDYLKVLELQPGNQNAKEMLLKIEQELKK